MTPTLPSFGVSGHAGGIHTFPVGTVITGPSGLADPTGLNLFATVAVMLYAGLVAACLVVTIRTARGVWHGHLLAPPVKPDRASTEAAPLERLPRKGNPA